jgi:hypothetical protein
MFRFNHGMVYGGRIVVSELLDHDTGPLRWRRKVVTCLVFLLAVLLIGAAIQFHLWTHRPMFHNDFGRNETTIFYRWVLEYPPVYDTSENRLLADYQLNLLVLFDTEGSTFNSICESEPRETKDGAVFHTDRWSHKDFVGKEVDFVVPRRENMLFVFRADGSREEFPLAVGEAKRIFTALREEQTANLRYLHRSLLVVLPQMYSINHSQEEVVRLRAVLARAQKVAIPKPQH